MGKILSILYRSLVWAFSARMTYSKMRMLPALKRGEVSGSTQTATRQQPEKTLETRCVGLRVQLDASISMCY